MEPVHVEWCGKMRWLWTCVCICENTRNIAACDLVAGRTTQCRSCGNRQKAALRSRLTHGETDTRLYSIFHSMHGRCGRESHPDFANYGGRGISVCSEWASYEAFRDWAVSSGYGPDLTIDRENNDLGYSPDNCRWLSRKGQNRNRRDNIRYLWRGREMMLSEIAENVGISHDLLRQRVRRDGLSIEQALSRPIRKFRNRPLQEISA